MHHISSAYGFRSRHFYISMTCLVGRLSCSDARALDGFHGLAAALSKETGVDSGDPPRSYWPVRHAHNNSSCSPASCLKHSLPNLLCHAGLSAALANRNFVVLRASERTSGESLAFAAYKASNLGWHVSAIVTAPSARRQGIASTLLQASRLFVVHWDTILVHAKDCRRLLWSAYWMAYP